jgi:hypothetical protein
MKMIKSIKSIKRVKMKIGWHVERFGFDDEILLNRTSAIKRVREIGQLARPLIECHRTSDRCSESEPNRTESNRVFRKTLPSSQSNQIPFLSISYNSIIVTSFFIRCIANLACSSCQWMPSTSRNLDRHGPTCQPITASVDWCDMELKRIKNREWRIEYWVLRIENGINNKINIFVPLFPCLSHEVGPRATATNCC